ncbi:globin domain-containing protein [Streptomyces massasporeus]|uniref:globin domain-containing protein n=1 Tax=Streptomyces massasporeus TaxID=67324 RepID=UPI00340A3745
MISTASRDAVRDSLPLVSASIEEIARSFYASLFEEHPVLIRRLFNRGNQATGEQQAALANGLVGFAGLVVHRPYIEVGRVLERIAHKHASVGVQPEQYQLVHDHLLGAFARILGRAATDRVTAAWSELYWLFADGLVRREAELYGRFDLEPGKNWRQWVVAQRVQETRDVISLVLEPADEWPTDPFVAGQYVSVAVPVDEGSFQIRQYSISSAPGTRHLRITIERSAGPGRPPGEVSSHLHDQVPLGATLLLSPPFGEVVLDDSDRPVLLMSSGVGVAPLMSMLGHLANTGSRREVTYVHMDRSAAGHALRFELEELVAALPNARQVLAYGDLTRAPRGAVRLPLDFASLALPLETRAYLCGPPGRMRTWRTELVRVAGLDPGRIRYEVFGPDLWRTYT